MHNASCRDRTYDRLITYHFGFRRPCGSWSGLCLHPVWVLSIKSLHLRISALGSALPVKGSPNLKSDSMSIPTQGFLRKSTALPSELRRLTRAIVARFRMVSITNLKNLSQNSPRQNKKSYTSNTHKNKFKHFHSSHSCR